MPEITRSQWGVNARNQRSTHERQSESRRSGVGPSGGQGDLPRQSQSLPSEREKRGTAPQKAMPREITIEDRIERLEVLFHALESTVLAGAIDHRLVGILDAYRNASDGLISKAERQFRSKKPVDTREPKR